MSNFNIIDGYTYKGYTYTPWDDRDEDCIKIWHDFKTPNGEVITCDFSPYRLMTQENIHIWVDLGCPERIGYCPLDTRDLNTLWKEHLEIINTISSTFID